MDYYHSYSLVLVPKMWYIALSHEQNTYESMSKVILVLVVHPDSMQLLEERWDGGKKAKFDSK